MSPKATAKMVEDAKKDGAKVTSIRRVQKPKPVPESKTPPLLPDPVKNDELQALRDEISELRSMIEQTKGASRKRAQELSAILTAMGDTKPVRVKPVRDMDPQSKTYLLVEHYDFIPVSYRKLDS